jgi:hypothetical protein
MPRKTVDPMVALYADFQGGGRRDALDAAAQETRDRLMASTRPDMAGAPINTYFSPQTYQQRVQMIWSGYSQDPMFGRLVNRFVEFAANGSQWEVPGDNKENSWIKLLQRWSGNETRADREEDVWNYWSATINRGVPNVIPGLNEIVRWAVKHMLLGAMWVPHWKIGEVKIGKQTYLMPTQLTCYPGSGITLSRRMSEFVEEEIWLFRPVNNAQTMQEGMFQEAPSFAPLGTKPSNMILLPQMSPTAKPGDTEAFALKYNWSPGDLTAIRRGSANTMGSGVYPMPPFYSLLTQLAIRQKLFASDAAILDALINFIMMYKIGDKDHPPKPGTKDPSGKVLTEGTIETARRLIQEGRGGPALELFLPYYVDLKIITPDTSTLLSDTKYGATATEIFQAFGIFFARTQAGARMQLDKMNMAGFEEFVNAIRMQVKSFLELLAMHVVEINQGKLRSMPSWSPNPLNVKSDAFIASLLKLKSIGMISAKTLLRHVGIDDDVEIRRIVQELAIDTDDVLNENVPISYVQQAIQPDSGGEDPGKVTDIPAPSPAKPGKKPVNTRKTTGIPPTKQRGRPPGKEPPVSE